MTTNVPQHLQIVTKQDRISQRLYEHSLMIITIVSVKLRQECHTYGMVVFNTYNRF